MFDNNALSPDISNTVQHAYSVSVSRSRRQAKYIIESPMLNLLAHSSVSDQSYRSITTSYSRGFEDSKVCGLLWGKFCEVFRKFSRKNQKTHIFHSVQPGFVQIDQIRPKVFSSARPVVQQKRVSILEQ